MVSAPAFSTRQSSLRDGRRFNHRGLIVGIGHRNVIDGKVPSRGQSSVKRKSLSAWSRSTITRSGMLTSERSTLLRPFDDQRARSSALHLPLAESVRMRMVPVEPRRLIARNRHAVVEDLAPASMRCV